MGKVTSNMRPLPPGSMQSKENLHSEDLCGVRGRIYHHVYPDPGRARSGSPYDKDHNILGLFWGPPLFESIQEGKSTSGSQT